MLDGAKEQQVWFKYLALDSEMLGFKTAKLLIEDERSVNRLTEYLDCLIERNFELVSWRVAVDDLLANEVAHACPGPPNGQQDTMICPDMSSLLVGSQNLTNSKIVIRDLAPTESKMSELYRLADRLLEYSHLALDARLPKTGVREIYRRWLFNSVRGYAARRVLVAEYLGRAVGFITFSWPQAVETGKIGCGDIGLLAVAQDMLGQHLGSALLDQALLALAKQRCCQVKLTTQTTNNRALNLYLSRHFKAVAYHNYYHFHLCSS